ncbi:MAG: ABC transporter ATP-binding protein/permease [Ruminococcus sp.]|nr:ABC transporter ATP-binding protein/permease [Ruminococcus sp.]
MKKLLAYMKGYIKECVLSPLFKMLEALLELFVPLVIAAVIDNGIALSDKGYTVKMCLVLVLLGFAGLAFSITAQYFAAKAAAGFVAKVRHALFGHILSLSYSDIDELGVSAMITRMTSDVNQVQSGVNLTLRLLLRSPFVVFGAMIMAFTIDVRAAMIFVYVTLILLAVIFGIMLCTVPLYKKVQKRLDSVVSITRENLTGVRVIRAFCKEEEEIRDFDRRSGELTASQKLAGKISALMNPVTYIIINMAIIVLINTGAVRVESGLLSQGAVVALYNYMSQILVELIKLANLIINITKSVACGNRIQSVLEIPAAENGSSEGKGGEYAVEFKNACLKYKNGGENALTDMTFSVKRGQTVGIIGGTGSGKTSLVNMIPGFYPASSGQVLVNGTDVAEWDKSKLRSVIGIVPQRAELFSGTVRDNLKWGNENASDEELLSALEAAQGGNIGGLDRQIEQSGKNLSGGQRQRLTVARALVRRPEILILDDSSSALDYATDAALRKSLKALDYSPAVFVVSQRTASIAHADMIIVLDDGEIAGIGSHEELLGKCGVYREIYSSQQSGKAV